jgi:hypothetical protein
MKSKSRTIIMNQQAERMLESAADQAPLVSRHRIAQAALYLGLEALVASPDRLVDAALASHGGRTADDETKSVPHEGE